MPDGADSIVLRVRSSLSEVKASDWDRCAGSGNPFVSHGFLAALEESGSACEKTGWLGQHLCLEEPGGTLIGAVPLYLKSHSYGEYVFDWGWADAYERAGGRYYPKLQCAIPFTPVTGPRLLTGGAQDREAARRALMAGLVEITKRHKVSSLHVTFCRKDEWNDLAEQAGFLRRLGLQYHWRNDGYRNFDDFLAALVSRKRKAIKKERRKIAESGIGIRILRGTEITEGHWDAFFAFYRATADKKWGHPYLTRSFFSLLGERLGDAVVLVLAEEGGRPVAGALNLRDNEALYGRNWGCLTEFKFLHFECCYYAAIDYAIAEGLARVEAGAQGEHKIQRGYLPSETYSAHLITDPGLASPVENFLERERRRIRREKRLLLEESPFRSEGAEQ